MAESRILLSTEARAVLRLASLLPRDWQLDLPTGLSVGDHVGVVVHGLFATAGVMRPLKQRIEALPGVRAASFSYTPAMGVVAVASELQRVLGRLPSGVHIHLVGHSMGGIAIRWFVQELGGDPRVVQTICIAAPFDGARGARLMPGQAGRDLRANSAVLTRLKETAGQSSLPHLTVLGDLDTAVAENTEFGCGERLVVRGCGHNALLFHETVLGLVEDRIRRHILAAPIS